MWKTIKNFPNYEVSDIGEIRNIETNHTLNPRLGKHGYLYVNLYNLTICKTFLVHRLVAQAFISNYENKRTVNHLNGIKTDNRLENLEWATDKENINHGWNLGLNFVTTNKPVILEIDNQIIEFESIKLCAEYLKVDRTTIRNHIRYRTKKPRYKVYYKEKDGE